MVFILLKLRLVVNIEKKIDYNIKWRVFVLEKYRGLVNSELEISKGILGEMVFGLRFGW